MSDFRRANELRILEQKSRQEHDEAMQRIFTDGELQVIRTWKDINSEWSKYEEDETVNRIRRDSYIDYAHRHLEEKGIPFRSCDNGNHLIVGNGFLEFNFWPSTGLFHQRPRGIRGRGISNLVSEFKPRK